MSSCEMSQIPTVSFNLKKSLDFFYFNSQLFFSISFFARSMPMDWIKIPKPYFLTGHDQLHRGNGRRARRRQTRHSSHQRSSRNLGLRRTLAKHQEQHFTDPISTRCHWRSDQHVWGLQFLLRGFGPHFTKLVSSFIGKAFLSKIFVSLAFNFSFFLVRCKFHCELRVESVSVDHRHFSQVQLW